jgi:hypothetical protein
VAAVSARAREEATEGAPRARGGDRDLHVCQPGRQALVYDLMEPHRPEVDRDVLAFIQSQTFTPRDFAIDAKGVCRLHPELARAASGFGLSDVVLRESVSSAATGFRATDSNSVRRGATSPGHAESRGRWREPIKQAPRVCDSPEGTALWHRL